MTLRSGMNSPTILIDKYVNTSYDTVKLVADNIDHIINASVLVGAYIVAEAEPTTRVSGSPLREGDRWYSTDNNLTYAWDGSFWVAIGANSTNNETHISTASQSTFTLANPYRPGSGDLLVFVDGLLQSSDSYTEVDANTVLFDSPISEDVEVNFIVGAAVAEPSITVSIIKKLYTAVGGETVVTIPDGVVYETGNGSLSVSINGLQQSLAAGAYTESSTTQVTFSETLVAGYLVEFTVTRIAA